MPITYTEIENLPLRKKAELLGIKEYVRVKLDEATEKELPFPSDYKFFDCFLPKAYLRYADRIENFHTKADDIWVVSYPKSGTTWTINFVRLLKNDLDLSMPFLNNLNLFLERVLYYEINKQNQNDPEFFQRKIQAEKVLDDFEKETLPRLIKSHLPAHLLPKDIWKVKSKVIYVYRDIKDVVVSMYHHYHECRFTNFQGSLDDFCEICLNDHILYGPICEHVNSFFQLKAFENVLLIRYEDLNANPFAEVKRIAMFLNYSYSDEQLKRLVEHVSFENMRSKYINVNGYRDGHNFFRKGKTGGYVDEMSSDYIQKFIEMEQQKPWNK